MKDTKFLNIKGIVLDRENHIQLAPKTRQAQYTQYQNPHGVLHQGQRPKKHHRGRYGEEQEAHVLAHHCLVALGQDWILQYHFFIKAVTVG